VEKGGKINLTGNYQVTNALTKSIENNISQMIFLQLVLLIPTCRVNDVTIIMSIRELDSCVILHRNTENTIFRYFILFFFFFFLYYVLYFIQCTCSPLKLMSNFRSNVLEAWCLVSHFIFCDFCKSVLSYHSSCLNAPV